MKDNILSEDDKIFIDHLRALHERTSLHANSVDNRISQLIVFNGVIFSLVFFKLPEAKSYYIFLFGLIVLLISVILGALAARTRGFKEGPGENFFKNREKRDKLNECENVNECEKFEKSEKLKDFEIFEKSYIFNVCKKLQICERYGWCKKLNICKKIDEGKSIRKLFQKSKQECKEFKECEDYKKITSLKRFERMLLEDIISNDSTLAKKSKLYNYMLALNVCALILFVVGYYV